MIKRILLLAVMAIVGIFGASAVQAEPGPNGNNDHGLCTAYFNGQKVGHGDGESPDGPRPFDGLQAAGEAYTDSDEADNDRDGDVDEGDESEQLTAAENIFNYCNDNDLIGGNPVHGRFTCTDTGGTDADDSDSDTDPECDRNEKPGNG